MQVVSGTLHNQSQVVSAKTGKVMRYFKSFFNAVILIFRSPCMSFECMQGLLTYQAVIVALSTTECFLCCLFGLRGRRERNAYIYVSLIKRSEKKLKGIKVSRTYLQ